MEKNGLTRGEASPGRVSICCDCPTLCLDEMPEPGTVIALGVSMRAALLSVVVLGGCGAATPLADGFAYQSTLSVNASGVVLHADGSVGHAGMFRTNCPFETSHGQVTGDYELPDADEEVQDQGGTPLGVRTVVLVQPDVAHLLFKSSGSYSHVEVYSEGLREARIAQDGLVAWSGDALSWLDIDGAERSRVSVPEHVAFDVEPELGLAALVGDETLLVMPDGLTIPVDIAGDLVSVDSGAGSIYVAQRGEHEVTALGLDGSVQWVVSLDAEIRALAHAGDLGAVAVITAEEDGAGGLSYLDAVSGDRFAYQETPTPARDVTVSEDGSLVAFQTDRAVHFFRNVVR